MKTSDRTFTAEHCMVAFAIGVATPVVLTPVVMLLLAVRAGLSQAREQRARAERQNVPPRSDSGTPRPAPSEHALELRAVLDELFPLDYGWPV